MAPPAKRQRRNVVDSSDDDDDRPQDNLLTRFLNASPKPKGGASTAAGRPPTASPSPLKRGTRTLNGRSGANKNLSPSSSPQKPRARVQKKARIDEKGKSADLLTLFSNQTQRSQSSAAPPKSTPIDEIDPISDDDDDVSYLQAHSASIVGEKARKRLRNGPQASASSSQPNPSQLFVKPTKEARPAALDDDLRPWSEQYGPVNLEELAVHKKKVADVRRWIEGVTGGRLRQRVLLLKGAAGTGKTTTVRLLARDMGYELLEWRSPTTSFVPGMQSPSAQFEAFLGLGGKFGALDTNSDASENQKNRSTAPSAAAPRIILIEEFPNTFTRSSTALMSFRNTILAYLSESTPSLAEFGQKPSAKPITPIILVVSETLLTTTSASADSFTAHRLLGPDIIRHPGTGVIEFNDIAPSLLAKALELVVLKEARKSGRRRTPGPQVLKRLGEIGDIRSAISSLEFLCLKGDMDGDWGAKVSFAKVKRGARNGITLTRGETESLEQISRRESSLGIFHAVGKVVYNKRDDVSADDPVEALPDHLKHCERPKRSQVSVDTLIDETGSDTSTFISALHENYVLSCETANPVGGTDPLDHLNGCIEALSDSDLLSPSWDVFGGRGGGGASGSYAGRDAGAHVLRQDEIAFQAAVRGILFSLPYPVKRVAAAGKGGRGAPGAADAFKMFYPTSIKLWRAKEEMEAMIDVWSARLLHGEEAASKAHGGRPVTDGASLFLRAAKNNAHLASSSSSSQRRSQGPTATAAAAGDDEKVTPLLSLGSSARRELLLDRLPYMAHMARRKAALPFGLRDLEKVVSFGGPSILDHHDDEEAPDEVEEEGAAAAGGGAGEAWATDKPHDDGRSPRKRRVAIRAKGGGGVVKKVEKLVLSDDDIED